MNENDDTQPDYTRDKAIHIAVIVVCSLLIVGAFVHPGFRAMTLHGIDVIVYNARLIWEGIVDAVTF